MNAVAPPPAINRTLTIKERTKVRDLLDRHFDVEEGFYTNEYSDQRIAREVNVPFVLVSALRDAAYAPLKSDPAISELRRDIDKMLNTIKQHVDTLAALGQYESALTQMRSKLDLLERKYRP